MSEVDTARAIFKACLMQDRDTADRLLADALGLSSPQDDHIRDDRITGAQVFFGGRARWTGR